MPVETILNIIHEEGVEVEVYKSLSEWLMMDRQKQIVKSIRYKATVRAISKIAEDNSNKKEAIEGIKSLCDKE